MCGIFCVFSNCDDNITEELSKTFQKFSLNISRRGPNQNKTEICHSEDNIFLFAASVLWLQGPKLTKQPINAKDYLLVYNGDIFNDDNEVHRISNGDTKIFLEFFESNELSQTLFSTNGPFAFICLDKQNSVLYFGRDKYGRRSLLLGKSENQLVLSSVAKRNTEFNFIELPSLGLFAYDLRKQELTLKPWYTKTSIFSTKLEELRRFLNIEIRVTEPICRSALVREFKEPSLEELKFSEYLTLGDYSCTRNLGEISAWPKLEENNRKLKELLEHSIEKRIGNQPNFCCNCIREEKHCEHSLVGVLFSGGVDCAILALLADNFVDKNKPIDLLNVAFSKDDFSKAPDRCTGLQTFEELKNLRPNRQWNFVEINVSFEELDKERSSRIADLIYPLNTILDDSLGCALWFASRGVSENYISPCRTLLVGMGADELFGGYSRHQAAFQNGGWSGLHQVLVDDWENLPYRNLGRDDRVVSDHGRQLRTPYLDENFVEFVRNMDVWNRTIPSLEKSLSFGSKFFLRALAYSLGLKNAAAFKKRALQFGSRIANPKENAHEISPRLIS